MGFLLGAPPANEAGCVLAVSVADDFFVLMNLLSVNLTNQKIRLFTLFFYNFCLPRKNNNVLLMDWYQWIDQSASLR